MVILTDLATKPGDQIAAATQRLHDALRVPFAIEDDHVTLTLSIGASEYPRDGRDAQTLIERANAAMRAAKREPR
jgi:GGDEF domain-containing protein